MLFEKTKLAGVWLIKPKLIEDNRGFFSRIYCHDTFMQHGLNFIPIQTSISYNRKIKTLRGLHFQKSPKQEQKLIRCTHGLIFDVALDLRHDSATYCQWIAAYLSSTNRQALFIPPGVAHGFISLQDHVEVEYLIDQNYDANLASGVLWNDPAFNVIWPCKPEIISDKDLSWKHYET